MSLKVIFLRSDSLYLNLCHISIFDMSRQIHIRYLLAKPMFEDSEL
jgi:hypothetical protein